MKAIPIFGVVSLVALWAVTSALGSGCRKAPAEPGAAATPASDAGSAAVECDTLEAKCLAKADTHVDIGTKGANFTPPTGWAYAKDDERTITVDANRNAALMFAPGTGTKPDELAGVVDFLAKRLDVTEFNSKLLKSRLKHPESKVEANGEKLKLWEVDKKHQGKAPLMKSKPGAMLVVVAPFKDQPIVAVGFVVKPEGDAQAAAVMQAVQSLRAQK